MAILHHRSAVCELDWQLSGAVMAVSNATRDWIVEQAKAAQRAKVRDRAVARAVGEDFYDASRLETVKRSIVRMLERDGEQPEGKLKARLGTREKRDLFDQATALLSSDQKVSSREYEYNGRRITVWSTMTTSVNHEKPSSETLTTVVNHDHTRNMTQLEKASSPESDAPPEGAIPDPTATPEETVKPPRPTTCERCYVQLPAAATAALCDDCDGAPAPNASADRPTDAHAKAEKDRIALRVAHDGTHSDGSFSTPAQYRAARQQQTKGKTA